MKLPPLLAGSLLVVPLFLATPPPLHADEGGGPCSGDHTPPRPPDSGGSAGDDSSSTGRGGARGGARGPARGLPSTGGSTGTLGGGGPLNPASPSGSNGAPQEDLLGWQMWWGFNRDPYLDVKGRILEGDPSSRDGGLFLGHGDRDSLAEWRQSRGATDEDFRDRAGPALQHAVERESCEVVRAAALVSIAKLHPVFVPEGASSMVEFLSRYLPYPDAIVQEAALVALGLLGEADGAIFLVEIARDSELGRTLVGEAKIPRRTRALAALALGVAGAKCPRREVRSYAVHHLAHILENDDSASPDLAVACVTSIGLMPLDDAPDSLDEATLASAPPSSHRAAQIRFLREFLEDDSGSPIARAHAPKALASLLRPLGDPEKEKVARTMLDLLAPRGKAGRKTNRYVQYGLVFALGTVGDADEDEIDLEIRETLLAQTRGRDALSRNVALVSLALVSSRPGMGTGRALAGMAETETFLLGQLARGKSGMRAWASLALGVQAHHRREVGDELSPDALIALRHRLRESRSPSEVGALCLALGLGRDEAATPLLIEQLERTHDELARGNAAIALGFVNARESIPRLREILAESLPIPTLMRDAAIALALLGDQQTVRTLIRLMQEEGSCAVLTAAVQALSHIGDRRAVAPLADILVDNEQSANSRRNAAISLGVVCERDPLPWICLLESHLNYSATTATLISAKRGGILDHR